MRLRPVAERAGGSGCRDIEWHWLGTDNTTRDVLARVIYGFRISVLFGLALAAVSSLVGVVAGAVVLGVVTAAKRAYAAVKSRPATSECTCFWSMLAPVIHAVPSTTRGSRR